MSYRDAVVAIATMVLTATVGVAGDQLQSGPAVGKNVAPFLPTNITGAMAGKKNCLVCENRGNPVAMIFAREINGALTSLIKKIDAETVKNRNKSMGSFVVFLNDQEGMSEKAKALAAKEGLRACVLAIDNPAGPEGYDIAKNAEVTVILYVKGVVEANFTFRKGELNDKAIDAIVRDVGKILK